MQSTLPPPAPGAVARLYITGMVLVLSIAAFGGVTYARRAAAVAAERSEREQVVQAGSPVLTTRATMVRGPRDVTLPGDVRAFRQVTLYAKVSGYLREMKVDKGDHVKVGQVLGILESPETDQQVLSLKADMAVKKQVAARYRALVGKGVVSQQEMDKANADLESANAELARLTALQDYEIIRAPFAGAITARYVDAGALVPAAAGSTQNAQPLVDLVDMNTVRIFVYLGQAEAQYVQDGDKVHITGDADENLDITAPITRITRALDPRTRTMLAEIDLDNRKGPLYPGLFVHVTLQVKAPAGLTIPADAVVLRHGQTQVAVIEDGHAHFRNVHVSDDDGQTVRVLAGLKEGEVVGLHVGDEVSDGAAVSAQPEKK